MADGSTHGFNAISPLCDKGNAILAKYDTLAEPGAFPAPVEPGSEREALESARDVLKLIRQGVSPQAYDLTGCIERCDAALLARPAADDAK